MPELSRLSLLLALVGSLLAPSLFAGDVQTTEVGGVRCTASYSWPDLLCHGYFPVPIELANFTEERVEVSMVAEQGWGASDRITKTVSLGAGERFEFELLLRALSGPMSEYRLMFQTADDEQPIGGRGPGEFSRGNEQVVMYFSPVRVDESTTDEWEGRWEGSTSGHGEFSIGAALFEELSPSWEAYSSLDSVVLDLRREMPGEEQLEALVAWARSGGRLILITPGGSTRLKEVSSIAGWLEDRFEIPHDSLKGRKNPRIDVFHAGTGFLVLVDQPPGEVSPMEVGRLDSPELALMAHELELTASWFPAATDSRADRVMKLLSGFGNLPLRSLMLLLVLFAVLMGPVNFIWVRRMKKPMLLLVTVPGIAVVTSLALLTYGILSQGLDVKSMTRSWSVLDQRANHATTVEVRRLFAGSSPGLGLRPERGTAIFPEARFWRGSYNRSNLFTQDLNDGRLLAGDYLQIRQPMGQLVLSDRTARVRLEARYVGEEIEVSNALGTRVEELLLRTPDGEYHELRGPLDPGVGARLARTVGTRSRMAWSDDLTWVWGDARRRLPPGTYLARLDGAALRDDCGVETNEIEGRHIVMGILDGDEEGWR